jgi:hypothetical protein
MNPEWPVSLLEFFEWCEASAIGEAIRSSPWLFPVIESIHLLGLAMLGGALLVLDLRLLNLALRLQPVTQLAKDTQPWVVGSLVVMISTGIPLFLSESIKCYYSPAFWVKMTALPLAILFTFTVRRKIATADETRVRPALYKLVALVSLSLWFTVGAGGRWIGFS